MADEKIITLNLLSRYHNKISDEISEGSIYRGATTPTDEKYLYWIDDSVSPALFKYKNELGGWSVIGGGGGAATNNAEFTVTNTSGWLSKTVAYGADCVIKFNWSSIEDGIPTGNGIVKISVGGSVRASYEEVQGDIEVDISRYLVVGANDVEITISDLYGNSRTYKFSITAIQVSISSYFDATRAYTGDINYSYIPVGAVEKTVYFLVDGEEISTQTVTASNREQSFTIPAQPHGRHSFEVYFECVIDGQTVPSNRLVYDLICYEEGNTAPIIASAFSVESVKQYATVPIKWIAYTPNLLTTEVTIADNFGYSTTRTVDRTEQTLSYKAENIGATELTFSVDGVPKKTVSFSVVENKIDVNAETANLELYLNAKGRSNQDTERDPSEWVYGNIKADLRNFNFISDGWQLDEQGDTVLRVSGNARVYIPLNIFAKDFRTSGKTIEFEFATRDVLNPNATVISCWSGNRGIKITAQEALLKSELSEISRQYKENEHIRIAFTAQKKAENRLISLYINGIESACVQYGEDDDFSQSSPVGISIGSNLCTTDIYCIRVYANNLTRYQVLDNWIADTQDIEELITRANRNAVFDDYGRVDITKLPQTLPYFVVDVEKYSDLPQYKGDKKTVSGKYVDPLHPERSFTFYGAQIDVQGTSSQFYPRKNYKIKFKNGFTINGVLYSNYQLRETSMPTNVFTFKADVASSEGANNVELVMLYDEICPVKTPPQETDSRVRQGIEGYPCLMFYYDGSNYSFLGKYNFNNDKETAEVFGFEQGDESWEILTNETQMAVFKDDDFESTYTDTVTGKDVPLWAQTFEARYPEENNDTTNLNTFVSWLKSTDTTAVDNEEEKTERLTRFKEELADYANVEALIFNYVYTEMFLMVDNRAKNAFPTRYDEDGKFLILPYDYDTAIGINNEGELKFGYWLEDTDFINGTKVYNGQDSVLYVNLRLAFADEIMAMYQELRKLDAFSYDAVEERFRLHQQSWGEAIFNEDAKFKYIDPLVEDGDNTYLEMLQGSKESQRQWWLYNRFRYLDSKYVAGDSLEDYIMLRPYAVSDITITPYADIYASIKFDNILVQERALRGDGETPNSYTLKNPLESGNHGVIAIYSASQLASVGDLSGLKAGMANFSMATKLNEVKLGDGAEGYENPNLNTLTIGNLSLLSKLDIRNCTGLSSVVDVSGCANIEEVYAEGSSITGVKAPNGGILKVLHLPETTTSLIIQNQPMLTDFSIPSFSNVSTLRLEGVSYELFDFESILNAIQPNSRVRLLGIEMNIDTAEEIFALYDKFDTFRGLDEENNTLDNAVIGGTIHCGTITSNDYAEMMRRYPNIKIEYEHITSNVYFYVEGNLFYTDTIFDGAKGIDPVGVHTETPTKPEENDRKFVYIGWDKEIDQINVTEDIVVNARFESFMKYFVTFKDDKGNIVQVNGNDTNVYYNRNGENVVALPDDLPDYSEEIDGATYDFYFKGWRNTETLVEGVPIISGDDYNLTYEAVFTSFRVYVVKFVDYDGKEWNRQHLYEGEAITVPVNPSKASDAQYDYPFKGWSTQGTNLNNENVEAVASVVGTADITYYAVYDSELRYYYITFLDWDGTEKSRELLGYGSPVTIPTVSRTGYTFREWLPAVNNTVTSEATYKAEYDINYYAIRFLDYDGSVINEQSVAYNTMPVIPADPTRESTPQYDYTFVGWTDNENKTPDVATINIDYTAVYSSEVRSYIITFLDYDDSVISTQSVKFGSMPTVPAPTRTGYDFTGWDKSIVAVEGKATYKAQYKIKVYTITWVVGNVIETTTCEHGKTPAPPYSKGESVMDGSIKLTIQSWPEITVTTDNKTYKAQATATITARPTRYTSGPKDNATVQAFIAGTGDLYCSPGGTLDLYGFDFSELRNYQNVSVTGFTITTVAKRAGYYTNASVDVQFITWSNNQSTKLFNEVMVFEEKPTDYTSYTLTDSSFSGALSWINSNIDKVIDDLFGLQLHLSYGYCKSIEITFNLSL